ncbi:hypothetical protein JTE90_012900 [Oedothorax gibbosus]|uniref:Homeobox domain-containing protein n=1 Tax=Oedothorax gibbosus TaxID=931172 RepID=A0AAV6U1F7_9ARAC|nr:hypothetical protein JTE90_012900 [Oedothorax gibbosus]
MFIAVCVCRYDSVSRRKNATRETTNTLKAWLYEHRKNPYPTKGEKIMLAIITKMTLTQVSTWFANARRRLKKENKMTWEPRNKTSEGDDDSRIDDEDAADFLKQHPDSSSKQQHGNNSGFSFDPQQPKSPFVDCFRSEEGSSSTESPAFKHAEDKEDFASHPPPKIWSLARTATSDSPPAVRKPVPFDDYGQTTDRVFCEQYDRRPDKDPKEGFGCSMYCKEDQVCISEGSRKVDGLKDQLAEGFGCKLNESAADCELKQRFYSEKTNVLKEGPTTYPAAEVTCELKQGAYYDVGQKPDILLKHPHEVTSYCKSNESDVLLKHSQTSPYCKVDESDVLLKPQPFCKTNGCCESELKHRSQVPFYGEPSKDHPMSGFCPADRFVANFAKCEVGGASSCMLQQQTYTPAFSGDAYARSVTYAPGSNRGEYFAPDRFDQTTSGSKGISEDSR